MGNSCCKKTYTYDPSVKYAEQEVGSSDPNSASAVATDGNHGNYKTTEARYAIPETEPEGGWREMPIDVEGCVDSRLSKDWNGEVPKEQPAKPPRKTHKKTTSNISIDTSDTNFDPSLNLALATPVEERSDKTSSKHTSEMKVKLVSDSERDEGFTNPAFDDRYSSEDEGAVVTIERPKSVDLDVDSLNGSDADQEIMRSSAKITVAAAGVDNPVYSDSLESDEDSKPEVHRKRKTGLAAVAASVRNQLETDDSTSSDDDDSLKAHRIPADVDDVDLRLSGEFKDGEEGISNTPTLLLPGRRARDYSDSDSDSHTESGFVPMPSTAIVSGSASLESPTRVLEPAVSDMNTEIPQGRISSQFEPRSDDEEEEDSNMVPVDIPHLEVGMEADNKILPGIYEDMPVSPPLEPNVPYAYDDEEDAVNASSTSTEMLLPSGDTSRLEQSLVSLEEETNKEINKEDSSDESEADSLPDHSSPKKMTPVVMDTETLDSESDESEPEERSPQRMEPIISVTAPTDESDSGSEGDTTLGSLKITPARKLSISSTSSSSSSSSSAASADHRYTEFHGTTSPVAKSKPEQSEDSDVELNFELQNPERESPSKDVRMIPVGAMQPIEPDTSREEVSIVSETSTVREYSHQRPDGKRSEQTTEVDEDEITREVVKRNIVPMAVFTRDERDSDIADLVMEELPIQRTLSPDEEAVQEDVIIPRERDSPDSNQRVIQMDPSLSAGMDDFDSEVDHPVIDQVYNDPTSSRERRDSSTSCSEEEMAEAFRVDSLMRPVQRDASPARGHSDLADIQEVTGSEVMEAGKPADDDNMDMNELETAVTMSEESILAMSCEEEEDDSAALEDALNDLSWLHLKLWDGSDLALQEDSGFTARSLHGVDTEQDAEDWYQKELTNLNVGHSKWLKAAKGANFDEYRLKNILLEHKRLHRQLWLQRHHERERILGRLEEKLNARKSPESSDKNNNDFGASLMRKSEGSGKKPLLMAKSLSLHSDKGDKRDASSSEDDSDSDVDADAILKKYGELVKDSDSDDSPIEKYYVDSEDEGSSDDSDSAENKVNVEDEAALKLTLTHDIRDRLPQMTGDDFKKLMEMYRKERRGLQQMREGERAKLEKSLWARLEAQRLSTIRSESEKFEETGVNGKTDVTMETTTTTTTTETGSGLSRTVMETISSQGNGVSASTQMNNTLLAMDEVLDEDNTQQEETEQEITDTDQKFLERVAEAENSDRLQELMAAHLDSRRRLRLQRQENLSKYQQKLAEKLGMRGNSEQSEVVSNVDKSLATSKDTQFESELHELNEQLLDKVDAQADDLDAYAVEKLLAEHHEQERHLLEKRQLEKLRFKQKLAEKMRERQKAQEEKEVAETPLQDQLEKMDGDFYQVMLDKRQQGEISDEAVTKMVSDHLKRVEEFMAKLNLKTPTKKKSTKKRSQEAADPSRVSILVEQEQEQRKHVQKVRKQEREQLERKMQQKLRQKKQPKIYAESPELPPPKLPPGGKKQKLKPSAEDRMDYENVEIYDV